MSGISAAVARLALLFAVAAGPAVAAEDLATPPFPANLQHEVVTRWITSSTDLPPTAPLVFGSDAVAAILSNTQKSADKSIRTVSFREEGTAANFVTRMGGRSIYGEAEVDCRARAIKLNELVIYAGSNRKGREISHMGPRTDWRVPTPDRVLARVVSGACGAAKPLILASGRVPTPAGLKPSVPANPTSEAPVAAKPAPAPPPAAPVKPAAPLRPVAAAPTAAPAPAKPPAPKPAPSPPPAKAPPAPVQAQAPKPKPAPPPAPIPAATPAPAVGGGVRVQIGAVPTAAIAGQEWDRIARQFPDAFKGRSKQSMKVSTGGGELHRVIVGGFASKGAAQGFCATLQAKGQACFIRN